MSTVPFIKPVEDSVAKINDEVAVGEDLKFQSRWWRFERAAWILFSLILLLDLLGVFGRGPVAHAELRSLDMHVKYERIARSGTPTILDIAFAPSAIHDGKIELFVSESMVKELGTQRVIPAPISTVIGGGGLTYTFPASSSPATVQFAMQPTAPGIFRFAVGNPGAQPLQARVIVVP